MKPASIISLIIAVLLIIVGLVTCFIAQNMANANGQFLFAEEIDGDYRQTVDLTDTEISKIELIADNITVNIYGRSEKSYVEFINFRENYYSLSTSNRILSFDEIPDITSMLKFWENGFSFKGMRYLINFKQKIDETREKKINIYLSSDKEIKIFDIKSSTCIVNIESMTTGTDYNITADNLTLNTKVVKTSSTINVNAGRDDAPATAANLNLQTTFVTNLNVNASELNLNADLFRCNGIANIVCDTGEVRIAAVKDPTALTLDLKTVSGRLYVNEDEVHTPYAIVGSEEGAGSLAIESISADIHVVKSTSSDTSDAPADHEAK